jgi:uncharacterized protein (DUF58 family)
VESGTGGSAPRSRILPTRRLAALALCAAAVSAGAGYAPWARAALVAFDVALVLGVALDALLSTGPPVELARAAPAIFSVGRPNAVQLHLRSRTWRRLRGTVADDPLEGCVEIGCPAPFDLPPRGEAVVRYEVVPSRRGPRTFGAVTARYPSPLGLLARQDRAPRPAPVDVYPDVHAARALELLRRQGRQGVRVGSMRVRGGDTEFERLRPYQRGDEIRHVDWRASARRDDLTVRQLQAESNQSIVFALDVGRAMRGTTAGLPAVDHALNAALLTADVALRGGDRAGLLVFDDAPRTFLPPAAGLSGGRKLIRASFALEAGLATTDYLAATAFLRDQVRARSLFVLMTAVLDARSSRDLTASVASLLPRHVPLCVLLRDAEVESLATRPASHPDELYVRAAAAEALARRDALVRALRGSGALVLDVRPGELTPELVQAYLDVKARRLL